jgi:hypothetical protein
MKMLSKLSANVEEADFNPAGSAAVILHEATSGHFFHVRLSNQGVMLSSGRTHIAIPLKELFALAQKHDEGFRPSPPKPPEEKPPQFQFFRDAIRAARDKEKGK